VTSKACRSLFGSIFDVFTEGSGGRTGTVQFGQNFRSRIEPGQLWGQEVNFELRMISGVNYLYAQCNSPRPPFDSRVQKPARSWPFGRSQGRQAIKAPIKHLVESHGAPSLASRGEAKNQGLQMRFVKNGWIWWNCW